MVVISTDPYVPRIMESLRSLKVTTAWRGSVCLSLGDYCLTLSLRNLNLKCLLLVVL